MNDSYPDAVDYMFSQYGFALTESFSIDDLEEFMNEQLKTQVKPDFMRCLMQALDRDLDGLVSYQEFVDSLYVTD